MRGTDPLELAARARAILTATAPPRALEGRRVLLARSREDNDRFGARLLELGAEHVAVECLRSAVLEASRAPLLQALEGARTLAFTSRRAVQAVAELAGELPVRLALAAVGPGTERCARAAFGRCELVAPEGSGASLGAALVRAGAGPVVVAGARAGLREVEAALERAGIEARRVEVYGDVLPAHAGPPLALEALDAVLLSSPAALAQLRARARWTRGTPLVTIGPTTAAAARAAQLGPVFEAGARDFEALSEALGTALGKG